MVDMLAQKLWRFGLHHLQQPLGGSVGKDNSIQLRFNPEKHGPEYHSTKTEE
jgi:hypothetical protein